MEYLTVEETAKLKGCSTQYIQKLIKDGKLESKTELNEKKRPKYLIPISALPDDIKAKYNKQKQRELGLQPELKEQLPETPLKHCLNGNDPPRKISRNNTLLFCNRAGRSKRTHRDGRTA